MYSLACPLMELQHRSPNAQAFKAAMEAGATFLDTAEVGWEDAPPGSLVCQACILQFLGEGPHSP